MRTSHALVTTACAVLMSFATALADPREDKANELRDEILRRPLSCDAENYSRFSSDYCFSREVCKETVAEISEYQDRLSYPESQRKAVGDWRRYVMAYPANKNCMKAVLGPSNYCKAVNLVKAFDPHLNCPSGGGTNGSCWVNQEQEEWAEGCKFED
ncbi:MAG: hypothetical protein K8S25_14435 [Alphaproteobacteria bacterium]|nr:hypothetical protein [Alphaproteobacteria bacterium]